MIPRAAGLALVLALAACTPEPVIVEVVPLRALPPPPHASDVFFAAGQVLELELILEPDQVAKLRADPRTYVNGVLRELHGREFDDVAVKLKGAAGSFRQVDDRPAFTLNVSKLAKGRDWHGLTKIHLNNSVQDWTYGCEYIASALMNAAGIPTPRVAHARIKFNGRDLGLYVVKEGFDKRFLKRHFRDNDGNLYDSGFVQDITQRLERDEGEGADTKEDLRALVAACRERETDVRWQKIEEKLDVERFITFMAMELMIGHWDGYTWNRNNYRIYFDPSSGGRAVFLPHGMDQIFQDPAFGILPMPSTLMAQTVMSNPAWRKRYRERINELMPLFEPARIHAMIDELTRRMGPTHRNAARDLKNRVAARYQNLRDQSQRPDPKPLAFDGTGIVKLDGWWQEGAAPHVELSESEVERRPCMMIRGESAPFVASFRKRVLLGKGIYHFEALVKTSAVVPLNEPVAGAAIRLSGGGRGRGLSDTTDWTLLSQRLVIGEEMREVVLVMELRASAGTAWFERESLVLRKVAQ